VQLHTAYRPAGRRHGVRQTDLATDERYHPGGSSVIWSCHLTTRPVKGSWERRPGEWSGLAGRKVSPADVIHCDISRIMS